MSGETITAWVLWGSKAGPTIRRVRGEPAEGGILSGPGEVLEFYVDRRLRTASAGQWSRTLAGARDVLRASLSTEASQLRERAELIERRVRRLRRRA